MKLEEMTKDERSLLLFFESQAVDYGGLIDSRRMNEDDHKKAREWDESGFIKFGRVAWSDIEAQESRNVTPKTHWVEFSESAWVIAHQERRARFERVVKNISVERIGAKAEV